MVSSSGSREAYSDGLLAMARGGLQAAADDSIPTIYFAPDPTRKAMVALGSDLRPLFHAARAKDNFLPQPLHGKGCQVAVISLAAAGSQREHAQSSQAAAAIGGGEPIDLEDMAETGGSWDATSAPTAPALRTDTGGRLGKSRNDREEFKADGEYKEAVAEAFVNDGLVVEDQQQIVRTVKLLKAVPGKMAEFMDTEPFSLKSIVNFSNSATKVFYEKGGLGGGAPCLVPRSRKDVDDNKRTGPASAMEKAASIQAAGALAVAQVNAGASGGGGSEKIKDMQNVASGFKDVSLQAISVCGFSVF